jgi:hypothetical protein
MEQKLLDYLSIIVESPHDLLLDDYLYEDDMPEDVEAFKKEIAKVPNLGLLIDLWSIHCPHQEKLTKTTYWDAIRVNTEAEFRTKTNLGKTAELRIHYLFQLTEIYYDEHDDQGQKVFNKWKICLLRTGLRGEYASNEDFGLIAAQLLIASEALETSLDNISAEIIWLRLGERDSVLEGISNDEAEALANEHFGS